MDTFITPSDVERRLRNALARCLLDDDALRTVKREHRTKVLKSVAYVVASLLFGLLLLATMAGWTLPLNPEPEAQRLGRMYFEANAALCFVFSILGVWHTIDLVRRGRRLESVRPTLDARAELDRLVSGVENARRQELRELVLLEMALDARYPSASYAAHALRDCVVRPTFPAYAFRERILAWTERGEIEQRRRFGWMVDAPPRRFHLTYSLAT